MESLYTTVKALYNKLRDNDNDFVITEVCYSRSLILTPKNSKFINEAQLIVNVIWQHGVTLIVTISLANWCC